MTRPARKAARTPFRSCGSRLRQVLFRQGSGGKYKLTAEALSPSSDDKSSSVRVIYARHAAQLRKESLKLFRSSSPEEYLLFKLRDAPGFVFASVHVREKTLFSFSVAAESLELNYLADLTKNVYEVLQGLDADSRVEVVEPAPGFFNKTSRSLPSAILVTGSGAKFALRVNISGEKRLWLLSQGDAKKPQWEQILAMSECSSAHIIDAMLARLREEKASTQSSTLMGFSRSKAITPAVDQVLDAKQEETSARPSAGPLPELKSVPEGDEKEPVSAGRVPRLSLRKLSIGAGDAFDRMRSARKSITSVTGSEPSTYREGVSTFSIVQASARTLNKMSGRSRDIASDAGATHQSLTGPSTARSQNTADSAAGVESALNWVRTTGAVSLRHVLGQLQPLEPLSMDQGRRLLGEALAGEASRLGLQGKPKVNPRYQSRKRSLAQFRHEADHAMVKLVEASRRLPVVGSTANPASESDIKAVREGLRTLLAVLYLGGEGVRNHMYDIEVPIIVGEALSGTARDLMPSPRRPSIASSTLPRMEGATSADRATRRRPPTRPPTPSTVANTPTPLAFTPLAFTPRAFSPMLSDRQGAPSQSASDATIPRGRTSRRPSLNDTGGFQPGDRVDGLCVTRNGRGRWFAGVVIGLQVGCKDNTDATRYHVRYDDGDEDDNVPPEKLRRSKRKPGGRKTPSRRGSPAMTPVSLPSLSPAAALPSLSPGPSPTPAVAKPAAKPSKPPVDKGTTPPRADSDELENSDEGLVFDIPPTIDMSPKPDRHTPSLHNMSSHVSESLGSGIASKAQSVDPEPTNADVIAMGAKESVMDLPPSLAVEASVKASESYLKFLSDTDASPTGTGGRKRSLSHQGPTMRRALSRTFSMQRVPTIDISSSRRYSMNNAATMGSSLSAMTMDCVTPAEYDTMSETHSHFGLTQEPRTVSPVRELGDEDVDCLCTLIMLVLTVQEDGAGCVVGLDDRIFPTQGSGDKGITLSGSLKAQAMLRGHLQAGCNAEALERLRCYIRVLRDGGWRTSAPAEVLLNLLVPQAEDHFGTEAACIGAGRFGTVFRVRPSPAFSRPCDGEHAAMKRIPEGSIFSPMTSVTDLYSEVLALRTLRHHARLHDASPIAPILYHYGAGKINGYFLCMEHCEGGSLAQWRQDHGDTMPHLATTLRLFAAVCRKLAAAHALGLAHLDIKMDNILLARPLAEGATFEDMVDAVRIADWGEVLLGPQAGAATNPRLFARARGTEAIQSPEMLFCGGDVRSDASVAAGIQPGAASDVWALGCLLFEMLAGDFLFVDLDFARFFVLLTAGIPGTAHTADKAEPLPPPAKVDAALASCSEREREHVTQVMGAALQRLPSERPSASDLCELALAVASVVDTVRPLP
mmetsp:Transcript_33447/g.105686  ORF Transcript_33447/g.105686 Transcript_33447/m.105686 type:complete len:1378 (-) Transcript_33447:184-4317(-)